MIKNPGRSRSSWDLVPITSEHATWYPDNKLCRQAEQIWFGDCCCLYWPTVLSICLRQIQDIRGATPETKSTARCRSRVEMISAWHWRVPPLLLLQHVQQKQGWKLCFTNLQQNVHSSLFCAKRSSCIWTIALDIMGSHSTKHSTRTSMIETLSLHISTQGACPIQCDEHLRLCQEKIWAGRTQFHDRLSHRSAA